MTIGAVILAAGLSSRMGEFKPLIALGSKTMLEHCVALFRDNGIEEIIAVAGHRADRIRAEANRLNISSTVNPQFKDGMFSSIQAGVRILPPYCDAFFLLPVDIPLVQPGTVEQLLKAHASDASVPVHYPVYQQRRGHPPLINSQLTEDILTYSGTCGMRGLLRNYEGQACDIKVDDQYIVMDADTKEELAHLISVHSLGRQSGKLRP